MSETEGPGEDGDRREDAEDVLRAKYHDYCSAKVADALLGLSPEEMYLLAESAARESGMGEDLPHTEVVRLATERVTRQLGLPPFEEWVEDYRAHPERYDDQLMGLWESESGRGPVES